MWSTKTTSPIIFFAIVLSLFLIVYANVSTFYPFQFLLRLQDPPVYYVGPKSSYLNNMVLSSRVGVNYTDFENVPGWNVLAGSWSWPAQGFSGVGYSGSGNPALSVILPTLSSSTTWFVSSKVMVSSNDAVYRGIVLCESASRFFLLALYGGSRLEILEYRNGWRTLSSVNINIQSGWYILNSTYSPTSRSIRLEVYNTKGELIASTSASSPRVSPSLAGVGVRGGTGNFDDFIVSYDRNGVVRVSKLESGWTVTLYDSSGAVVASSVSGSSGTAGLNVRVKPVVRNAAVVVRDPLGNVIVSQGFEHVVGGDALTLYRYNIIPQYTCGENGTSFYCELKATGSLHVFDHDLNGMVVASRSLNYRLGTNNYVTIRSFAHLFNVTDPNSYGVVILEAQCLNGTVPVYFSFYYYGGNSVYAGSRYVSLDMNFPHFYAITLYLNGSRLTVSYYVDGVKVNSEYYNVGTLNVVGFHVGRYAAGNMYDIFLDMVSAEFGSQSMQPLYEDFDDGVDNFFVNSYWSGNAGKDVVYYVFPTCFAEAHVSDNMYYFMRCNIISFSVSGKPSVSLWLYNGLEHSAQIKIVAGVIVYTSTSELLVDGGGRLTFCFNGTFPANSNVTMFMEFSYKIDESVRVVYPLNVVCKA
ncbi:MAG: hypothetical protein QXV85_10780 [Candidatus Bathyarchaeia archaeon]